MRPKEEKNKNNILQLMDDSQNQELWRGVGTSQGPCKEQGRYEPQWLDLPSRAVQHTH